jgi:hypothetical protein
MANTSAHSRRGVPDGGSSLSTPFAARESTVTVQPLHCRMAVLVRHAAEEHGGVTCAFQRDVPD